MILIPVPLIPWLVPIFAICIFLLIQYLSFRAYQESLLEQFKKNPSKTLIKFSELLYHKIRVIIYVIGICWVSIGIASGYFLYGGVTTETLNLWVRFLGFSAIIWFFWVLTPGLLTVFFPRFALNSLFVFARRALGKVTFFMALSHAVLAFLHNYKGDVQIFNTLSEEYKLAVVLGVLAILILSLLAATSFDLMMKIIHFKRWKRLHRLIYLAILFSVVHAFLRGTSFKLSAFALFVLIFVITFILLELGATAQMLWRHRKYRSLNLNWLYISILGILGVVTLIVGFQAAEKILQL